MILEKLDYNIALRFLLIILRILFLFILLFYHNKRHFNKIKAIYV